jgi:glycosyltransferase involved in cell wall biosynthesis
MLQRRIHERRPDIVHTHLSKAGVLGRIAARRAKVPVVVHTYHGHIFEGYFRRPVARGFLEIEKRLARSTDALLAVSPEIRDQLLTLGIGKPSQWHVIPLGLELDHLLANSTTRPEARAALGLPSDRPIVGIVGRLVPIKAHHTFFQAASLIAQEEPNALFVVAGDGELRGELERAGRAALGERIRFLGWVSDLPLLYAALDVAVLSSENEGTPVALIEAGAAGLPTVATSVGGVPDVIQDGTTGLLVPAKDQAALAGATVKLLTTPELRRSIGLAARERVRDRYAAEVLVKNLAALYENLVGQLP